jgi:hypothetical protein
MVQGLEVELRTLPHLAQGDVVLLGLAVGRVGVREVRQRDQKLLAALVELVELRLELLELGLERARLIAELGELGLPRLARLGGLLDLGRELVLLRPDRIGARVELASALVDRDQLIELRGRSAPRQGGADPIGIGADLLQVERGSVPLARGWARRSSWSSGRARAPR